MDEPKETDRPDAAPPAEIPAAEGPRPAPNQKMLSALAKVEEIQAGMRPKSGGTTQDDLREARSGAMYGNGPDEQPSVRRN
jgi:hypothetical protein